MKEYLENIGKKFFDAEYLKTSVKSVVIIFCDGEPMGSGVFINSNTILTAKHVVENYKIITAIQELNEVSEDDILTIGNEYTVHTCNISENSDLALLLTVEPYKNIVPRINFNYPNVNDYCMTYSYQKFKNEDDILFRNFVGSNGKILELYPYSRDSKWINYPSFCINTKFTPGMSGGPIFDIDGCLCGIVCTGSDGDDENEYAVGSLLHPLLGIKLQLSDDRAFTLIEMLKTRNLINTLNLDIGIELYNEYLKIK